MTQEDKELLIADLCGRLPYGVKVDHFGTVKELLGIMPSSEIVMVGYDINDYEDSVIEDIKPYLRLFSNMTDEEWEECLDLDIAQEWEDSFGHHWELKPCDKLYDWLNAHYFDYRNLIEKGLAIEVTEDNNPYK